MSTGNPNNKKPDTHIPKTRPMLDIPLGRREEALFDRRTMLFGLAAMAGGALITGFNIQTAAKVQGVMEGDHGKNIPKKSPSQERSPEKPLTLDEQWAALLKKFPELEKNPRLLLSLDHSLAHAFLESSSLRDLKKRSVLGDGDATDTYMNYKDLWERAKKKKRGTKEELAKWDEIAKNTLNLPDTKRSFVGFNEDIKKEIKVMDPMKEDANLDNEFTRCITSVSLLTTFIQEIGPGDMTESGERKTKNPKIRVELFRMMLDAGWQPNKVPALYDSAVSYGLGQMTLPTHNGIQNAHGDDTSDILESDFAKHTSIEQQVRASYLLALMNMTSFLNNVAKKCPNFMKVFRDSNDDEKTQFLTCVNGAYHNFGNRPQLRRKLKKSLMTKHTSLAQYAETVIGNIAGLPIAFKHARNSFYIFPHAKKRVTGGENDIKVAEIDEGEEIASEGSRESDREKAEKKSEPAAKGNVVAEDTIEEDTDREETTLVVRSKVHPKTGKKMAYYSFTIPPINLVEFLKEIVTRGSLQDIKNFNKIDWYKPGDIMHVPVAYFAEDLLERNVVTWPTHGKTLVEMLTAHCEGGASDRNQRVAQLFGSTATHLRVPLQLVKED